MILLVHAAPVTLAAFPKDNLGVLSSPRRYYVDLDGWVWAADNDAFSTWNQDRYRKMLAAIAGIPGCVFVTAPDVVGDAAETLRRFEKWQPELAQHGQPIALVAQDGLRTEQVPWDQIEALFIGGSNTFKMGERAHELVDEAKQRQKWVHMGRVNTHQRLLYAKAIGCDSVDGSQFSWFRDRWLPEFLAHAANEPQLILGRA